MQMSSWEKLVDEFRINENFKSRTCCIFNRNPTCLIKDVETTCPCGRLIRRHSFNGVSVEQKELSKGNVDFQPPNEFPDDRKHSTSVSLNVYGTLSTNGCKFLRLDARCKMIDLFELILRDCNNEKPVLILSVYGGAKYFTMTERLEKEFIRGIVDAATTADAWILTAGIDNGVSKLVGEGISHYRLLSESSNKVKSIGLTMWGTLNEKTRLDLKTLSKNYPIDLRFRQISDQVEEDKENIESNHTHCILFDSGRLNEYLSDSHRNEFVKVACNQANHICHAVTIIVEGGLGSLEVLSNDIKEGRPIVLIQGSGRLADLLSTLIEQTSTPDGSQQWSPTEREIENIFDRFFPHVDFSSIGSEIRLLKEILKEKNRFLLHVFSLERDQNVSQTIFKAIFNGKFDIKRSNSTRRTDENKLVDLALKWNYFDGILSILQTRHDEMIKEKNKDFLQEDFQRQKELFRQSLRQNRPKFVEYFLSAGFNPLSLIEEKNFVSYSNFLLDLYQKTFYDLTKNQKQNVTKLFGRVPMTLKNLDQSLNKFVGAFFEPIYILNDDKIAERIAMDFNNHVCICCGISNRIDDDEKRQNEKMPMNNNELTKTHLLRDLFLWAIFFDLPQLAKVFLLQIRPRICAALIASAIYKKYSIESTTIDLKAKYESQSIEFETYAAICIDKCYEYNELRACELLLRQIPLFGNVTSMQVAISSESRKLLETACFDQTLNQVWYNKLALTNHRTSAKLSQFPAVLTLGILAPMFVTYRDQDANTENKSLSDAGINYYVNQKNLQENDWKSFWKKILYFHESPLIKMCYHFITYIWFLLVFSYMMLYNLEGRNSFVIPHWTEIYVIITVSTMFCEEVRKLYREYKTHMIERWGSTGSTVVNVLSNIFYVLPYFLFFLGLGFRYGSYNEGLLSTARIIWALDLELWYLRSLKFVIALKFLGPKLFMLKNMLRDLFAFVYMIFIAVSAYGVVSRAMIRYQKVPFTARGIFSEIFYAPYWFIYGEVEDKQLLDNSLLNNTDFTEAEATATHVLLAFHMLFINILLLNLLVAVFADSIGKVQENTEFYWRYQRYSFVREYFERVPFGYPPLIFVSHLFLFLLACRHRFCRRFSRNRVGNNVHHVSIEKRATPIFKMIPIHQKEQSEEWDSFENAATYSFARSVLEQNGERENFHRFDEISNRRMTQPIDSNSNITTIGPTPDLSYLKDEMIDALRLCLTETQKNFEQNTTKVEHRLNQMHQSIEMMMKTIERLKTNGEPTTT